MPSIFNQQLKQTQAELAGETTSNIWLPAHREWMLRSPWERVPTQAAMDHVERVLNGSDIPKREGEQLHRFSASKVNGLHGEGFSCHRAALFSYIGAEKIPPTVEQQDNMDQGNALHLHYQIEGLSAGYLASCETWDWDSTQRYGAKDDGMLYDASLLELKFVNGKKYAGVLHGNRQWAQPPGPLLDHKLQITGIMLLKGLNTCSLVYNNKENGEFTEYRLELNDALVSLLLMILGDLNAWVELDELPAILEGCRPGERKSWLGENCEYRKICPAMTRVTDALRG